MRDNKILKSTILLGVCSILAKVVAFAKDIALSYEYGAGSISDAYLVAISIPTILFTGILTALYTSYIPMYHQIRNEKGIKGTNQYTSNLIHVITMGAVLIIIFFMLFSRPIVSLFASGFDNKTFQLTVEFSQICIFSILFMGITYVLQGFLQVNNHFYMVALTMVPVNLILMIGIVISRRSNIYIMAAASIVAYFIVVPCFWKAAYTNGFRYILYFNIKDSDLRKTVSMIIPIFVGQMLAEINNIVDKNMASRLPAGYVTALDYSFKLSTMVHSILIWPIATIAYPRISQYISQGKKENAQEEVISTIKLVGKIVLPMTVFIVICSQPIVKILFFRGAFTMDAVRTTSEALAVYVLSAIPISYRIIMEKVYYSAKDTKHPVIFSGVGIGVNVILDILLLGSLKHLGLALATTVSCLVTTILYFIWMNNYFNKNLLNKDFIVSQIKTICATIVMAGALIGTENVLDMKSTGNALFLCIKIVLMFLIGTAVYATSMFVSKKVRK